MFYQKKNLLEKAAKMKKIEYVPLGKELKAWTGIWKQQHQELDDTYEFDKIIKKENRAPKKYKRSNLIYISKHSFYSGKVKHELRVTSSNPHLTSSNLRVTSSNPRVTSSDLRVTSSNPRVRRLKARVQD